MIFLSFFVTLELILNDYKMNIYSVEEIEIFVNTNRPDIVDVDWCGSMTETIITDDEWGNIDFPILVSYEQISKFIESIQLCKNLGYITKVMKNQFIHTFNTYDSVDYIDIHGMKRTYSSTTMTFGEFTSNYISICYKEAKSRALLYNKIIEDEIREEQKIFSSRWEEPFFPGPPPPLEEETYYFSEETPPQEEPKPDVKESSEITAKDIVFIQTQDFKAINGKKIVKEETVSKPNSPNILKYSIESLDSQTREFFKYLQKIGRLDKKFVPKIEILQKRNTYWWCLCKYLDIKHMWETLHLLTNQPKENLRRAFNFYKNNHPGFKNMIDRIDEDYINFQNLQKSN